MGISACGERLLGHWQGHREVVQGLAISPCGRRLYSAGEDGWLRCWSLPDGALCWSVAGHGGAAINDVAVAVLSAGVRLLTAGDDHQVRVWCAHTGAPLAVLQGHTDVVSRVCWAGAGADRGDGVVSASRDREVRIWSLSEAHGQGQGTGVCLHRLQGHGEWVVSLAVDPVGRRVIAGAPDQAVRCWSLDSGAALPALAASGGAVVWLGPEVFAPPTGRLPLALCVLPDGGVVAAGPTGLVLWPPAAPALAPVDVVGVGQPTFALAVLAGEGAQAPPLLVAAGGEGLELWSLPTSSSSSSLQPVSAVGSSVPLHSVVASPCGQWLCTADRLGGLSLWSAAALRAAGAPRAHERGLCGLVPGSGAVVSGERRRGRVFVWPGTDRPPIGLRHGPGDARPLLQVDAHRLLTASQTAEGGRLWLWDLATRTPLWTRILPGEILAAAAAGREGEGLVLCTDGLWSVAWDSGEGKVWSGVVHNLRAGPVSLSVAGTGAWAVTSHRGRSPQAAGRVWRRRDQALAGTLSVPAHTRGPMAILRFSPDGETIVGWGLDGWLHVWRRHGRRHRAAWQPHGAAVGALAFSPAGLLLTAVAGDVAPRTWTLAGERLDERPPLRARSLQVPVFSPDGRHLAAVLDPHEIQVTAIETGHTRALHHPRPLERLAFSLEGTRLGAIEADGRAVPLWALA